MSAGGKEWTGVSRQSEKANSGSERVSPVRGGEWPRLSLEERAETVRQTLGEMEHGDSRVRPRLVT